MDREMYIYGTKKKKKMHHPAVPTAITRYKENQ